MPAPRRRADYQILAASGWLRQATFTGANTNFRWSSERLSLSVRTVDPTQRVTATLASITMVLPPHYSGPDSEAIH